jgi:hypothetical protein
VNPASITNGAGATASAGSTLANIETDLLVARLAMVNANIPLAGCYWIDVPSTTMIEPERAAHRAGRPGVPVAGENGTLKGIPVIDLHDVGLFDSDGAGAGTAKNYIALVSAPQVLVADDGQVMLDASSEASISMTDDGSGTTLTSLWQKNMIGIRAERLIHWLRRRAAAAYVITDVCTNPTGVRPCRLAQGRAPHGARPFLCHIQQELDDASSSWRFNTELVGRLKIGGRWFGPGSVVALEKNDVDILELRGFAQRPSPVPSR